MIETDPRADEVRSGHKTQALAPAVLPYVPAGHETHVFALFAPVTPENASGRHAIHVLADKYHPASQIISRHMLSALAPTTEDLPTEQFIHCEFPVTFLNCPATHALQAPPSGPVYPALHLQSEIVLLLIGNADVDDAGHATQAGFVE